MEVFVTGDASDNRGFDGSRQRAKNAIRDRFRGGRSTGFFLVGSAVAGRV